MSQENVELIGQFYAAWNGRDFDRAVRIFDDEAFELHIIGGLQDLVGEEFRGREGALRFSRDMADTIGGRVEVERTFDLGERVVLTGTLEGSGAGSGAPTIMRIGQIWTFRAGKVIRVDSYYRAEDALEAAGLSE